jgi:membrane protease YdiL (CAAX protease family)
MVEDEKLLHDVESNNPWPLWTALGVTVTGFIVLAVTLAAMITIGPRAYSVLHFTYTEANVANPLVANVVSVIAGYLLARMLVVTGLREFFRSITWRQSLRQIAFAILLGLCATFVIRYIITAHLDSFRSIDIHPTPLFGLFLLSTVFAQPFAEEMYFRGILFSGLASKLNPVLSICIVTLVSVLGHVQHRWIVLPISILLGITRLLTKSTANCFFLHAAYNLGVVLWGIR